MWVSSPRRNGPVGSAGSAGGRTVEPSKGAGTPVAPARARVGGSAQDPGHSVIDGAEAVCERLDPRKVEARTLLNIVRL
jgi:hypothetical protein